MTAKTFKAPVEPALLTRIADEVGTPCFVYSAQHFLDPLHELQQGLEGLSATVCFAVKACSNLHVLQLLVNAGAGLDVVSGGELYRAEKVQAPAEHVLFSGVGKTPGEMLQGLQYLGLGIRGFNVESIEELLTLDAMSRELGTRAPIGLRFNPDIAAKTHPYVSTGLRRNKFGLSKEELREALRLLPDLTGVRLRGISIHIGSQIQNLAPLEAAFKAAFRVFGEVQSTVREPLDWLDLGGGLGVVYRPGERTVPIAQYTRAIQKAHRAAKIQPSHVFIEPGRAIAAQAGTLITEVLYRKTRGQQRFLIIDASMTELIRPALYQSHHEIIPIQQARPSTSRVPMTVVGPVCESADTFTENRRLPAHLQSGDLLAILSCGAYGFSMSSQYNSRTRPPEVLVEGDKYRIIRARETLDDLIRGEELPT